MNKNLTKVAALSVGLAMAIGVGVGLGARKAAVRSVKAAEDTVTWTATAAANLGSKISAQGETATGTISTGTYSWDYTRTLVSLKSGKTDYIALQGSTWIQLGSSSALESLSLTTSEIEGTIKSVTVVAATAGTHTLTIDVGGTKYLNAASLTTYSGNAAADNPDPANCAKTGTGTQSGAITITIASSNTTTNKAMLIRSISVTYETSGPVLSTMRVQNNYHKAGPFVTALGNDEEFNTLLAWDVTNDTPLRSGCAWSVSNLQIIDYQLNGETWFFWKPKAAGTVTVTVSCEGFKDATTTITVVDATPNPIQAIYSMSSGANVDIFGYYVGFLEGTGPVIMDGEYGVVAYDRSADVSSYTVNETILHVTGTVSIYSGLYEINNPVFEVATGDLPEAFEPVVYVAQGGETADKASRLTTLTGVPSLASGTFPETAGASDLTINFAVADKTVQGFYKKAAQTADADAFAAIKAAVEGEEEITVKGFTGWHNGFQVQISGVVEAQQDYTAEQFAQDLLDQTDAICAGWTEGTNNHDALVAVWSNLASADKYPSLPSDQKEILAFSKTKEDGTVIEQAMARYDFLTGKYNLNNFIFGRNPVSVHIAGSDLAEQTNNNNNSLIIVVSVIAAVSALSIGALLVIKKRKHN